MDYAKRPWIFGSGFRNKKKEIKKKEIERNQPLHHSDSKPVLPKTSPSRKIQLRPLLIAITIIIFLLLGTRYWWREMRWRYIIIHHTASDVGNLAFYRKQHKARWGDLAYHILIENGSLDTARGQIEYSQRWHKRQYNASTKKTYLNYFGIAVALVGNFENHPVPTIQAQTLVKLLLRLSDKYNIPPSRIIGHGEVQNTKCPGKYIQISELRELIAKKRKKTPH